MLRVVLINVAGWKNKTFTGDTKATRRQRRVASLLPSFPAPLQNLRHRLHDVQLGRIEQVSSCTLL